LVNTQAKAGGIFKNGYRRKRPRGITADGLANRSANAVDQSNERPPNRCIPNASGTAWIAADKRKAPEPGAFPLWG
jgi:hypothetical protein